MAEPVVEEDEATTEGMVVTFGLDGETFAVSVDCVDEIIDPLPVTRVPSADPFAPGLVNVRGQILPVLDLRRRLGMASAETTTASRVLVLDVAVGDEHTKVAVPADSVDEIVETDPEEIEAAPRLGLRYPPEYIRGVAKKDGALVIIINEETAFPPSGGRLGAV
jgi:purine-binding chemotaxis protein CheW